MTDVHAAKRIVEIQGDLVRRLPAETRRGLAAEQQHLWDQFFPSTPYEKVAGALATA